MMSKPFIFLNEHDEEFAHCDIHGVSGSELNNDTGCIYVDMFHAKTICVMIESDKHRSHEYLRLTTAIQQESNKLEAEESMFTTLMIGDRH
jgi:hypothetical protein